MRKSFINKVFVGVGAVGLTEICLNQDLDFRKACISRPRVAFAESKDKSSGVIPYVLIGGGTASYFAALTIRARDPDAKVLIIGDEVHSSYNRPALSKDLWWHNANPDDPESLEYIGYKGRKKHIGYEAEGFYIEPEKMKDFEHGCVGLMRKTKVTRIDADKKIVYLANGKEIYYDKCLIATGASPVVSAPFDKDELEGKVFSFKNIEDYITLRKALKPGTKVAVLDGGLLGTELSFSIKHFSEDVEVVQLVPESFCLSKVLPPKLAEECLSGIESAGVRVIRNVKVESAKKLPNGMVYLKLNTDRGTVTVVVDYVVDGHSWKPNVEIAEKSRLEVDNVNQGILANSELMVRKDIYAAGDVVSFYDPVLGRMRKQQIEHAEITGRCAGENMSGGRKVLPRRASFRSRVGETLFLEGVGITDPKLNTVVFRSDDKESFPRWICFYLDEKERIVGVITCNMTYTLEYARKLIVDAQPRLDLYQVAKLFSLYKAEKTEDSVDESTAN
ncbi:unnamed protein product [Bursaphelenchus xylophilus]|uniref:(pine wood nematode) hypothetical protein n=1 Tax=Bursaphelenchus xylophilus TaxID=6326 RepID=A0A1I7SSZ6_BURXY|nr:unnamed protein product [Bursaphelenchus xylophilus]CAG9108826.1 unnamed protein product [Bursaphelenchus xylophilus]